MKKIEYVNSQEMHRRYPDTFDAPSVSQLKKIKKGDSVKIAVTTESKLQPEGERFWVTVKKISGQKISGTIDNELVLTKMHGLKYKDLITFEKKNIYDIA